MKKQQIKKHSLLLLFWTQYLVLMIAQCGQIIYVHFTIQWFFFRKRRHKQKKRSYLGCHDHGGASPDAEDREVCLGRDKVQDLSDSLLVRVVTEHYALQGVLQRVPRHLCADPIDDALRIGLIHRDHLNFWRVRDVEEVLFLKSDPQGYFTRVAHQDDSNTEWVDQFGTDWGRRDDNTPLVAASPLATLSPLGTSRPCTWTSTPARLADGQEEYGDKEQREGQGEEGKGQPRLRTRMMRGLIRRRRRRRMMGGGWGEDEALVLKTGGRRVEADKHCGGV